MSASNYRYGVAQELAKRADAIQRNPELRRALERLRSGQTTREPVAVKLGRLKVGGQ